MLYLIKSASWNKKKNKFEFILKIGYTNDNGLNVRKTAYLNHNPTIEILYTIPNATRQHERRIHQYFEKYRVYGNEWYSYEDEIIRFFKSNNTVDLLDSILPEFNKKKTKRQIQKEIRDEKKLKYQKWINSFTGEQGALLKKYKSQKKLYNKLKVLCDMSDGNLLSKEIIDNLREKHFTEYFTILGADRIRALGYNVTCLNKELKLLSFDKSRLKDLIYNTFIPGNSYLYSDIKSKLKDIYSRCGYQSSAKAVDLEKYFKVISVNINIGNGKRSKGYKIIEKREVG